MEQINHHSIEEMLRSTFAEFLQSKVFEDKIRTIIREEVHNIVGEVVREEVHNNVREVIREEVTSVVRVEIQAALKPIYQRLTAIEKRLDKIELEQVNFRAEMNDRFRQLESKLRKQDERIDTLLEGWTIKNKHRQELDNHEVRITTIEQHVPLLG